MGKKLIFRHGTMASGKTLAMLAVAHNYTRFGQQARIFSSALDNRFGEGVVASRIGISAPATMFTAETRFTRELVGDVAVVLVDEAQFLDRRQIIELARLASLHSIPVIAYGLRTDYMGNPFPGSAELLARADLIEELKSVCECGSRANFQIRLDGDGNRVHHGDQVLIGDANYQQVCSPCFYRGL